MRFLMVAFFFPWLILGATWLPGLFFFSSLDSLLPQKKAIFLLSDYMCFALYFLMSQSLHMYCDNFFAFSVSKLLMQQTCKPQISQWVHSLHVWALNISKGDHSFIHECCKMLIGSCYSRRNASYLKAHLCALGVLCWTLWRISGKMMLQNTICAAPYARLKVRKQ